MGMRYGDNTFFKGCVKREFPDPGVAVVGVVGKKRELKDLGIAEEGLTSTDLAIRDRRGIPYGWLLLIPRPH